MQNAVERLQLRSLIQAEGATRSRHYWPRGATPSRPAPASEDQVARAIAEGRYTKCPPAYLAPVEGAAPVGPLPHYTPPLRSNAHFFGLPPGQRRKQDGGAS